MRHPGPAHTAISVHHSTLESELDMCLSDYQCSEFYTVSDKLVHVKTQNELKCKAAATCIYLDRKSSVQHIICLRSTKSQLTESIMQTQKLIQNPENMVFAFVGGTNGNG